MEAIELKELIEAQNRKLDELIFLNKDAVLKKMHTSESQDEIKRLKLYRIGEMVFNIVLVMILGNFIANHWGEIHFMISGIILEILAIVALIGSIGQVVMLGQIDYLQPVMEVRKKIELVKAHSFLFLKLILLSIPVWWAFAIVGLEFFLGFDIYLVVNPNFAVKYMILNALLVLPLIWSLNKLSYKNMHIKWVRKVINALTTPSLRRSLMALKKVDDFNKG